MLSEPNPLGGPHMAKYATGPQLLNPMPWHVITLGLGIVCRLMIKAGVTTHLVEWAGKTANPIDDALAQALAQAIEILAAKVD